MLDRLARYWVYGGFLAGSLLIILTPLLARAWPEYLVATFLLLPVYMLHQYEEHDADRFRAFFNKLAGNGREVLSSLDVFIINVPGVWGVIALSAYLAAWCNPGFGFIAVYLTLFNAFVHIVTTIRLRCYNPGLITALVLFVPFGSLTLWEIQLAGGGTLFMHALGLGIAVGIHAGIILLVRSRGGFRG